MLVRSVSILLLLSLACPRAHAGSLDDLGDIEVHWRQAKHPGNLQNLDATVRSEAEFNGLEIVLSARERPTNDWEICAVRAATADDGLIAKAAVTGAQPGTPACPRITPDSWELKHTFLGPDRFVSQGISVKSAVVGNETDPEKQGALVAEVIRADGTATSSAFDVTATEVGTKRTRTRRAVLTYDASVPKVEFQVATHPGIFVGAVIPCADIQEQGMELPAICERNPANGAMSTQLAIAPVGIRLRWAPINDATWLGFSADISAAVFGTSVTVANGTDSSEPSPSLGLQTSPGSAGIGLDFRVPLAKQTLHFALEGGLVIAPITDETVAFRPALMVLTSVPIFSLVAR